MNAEVVQSLVLYIEDNKINQELMASIFDELDNAELVFAEDAESGIEIAKAQKPNLILMDIGLPGMDGIEATRLLKTMPETKDIPVIAVSAAAMQADIDRSKGVGFFTYTTKPFKVVEILQVVEDALQSRV